MADSTGTAVDRVNLGLGIGVALVVGVALAIGWGPGRSLLHELETRVGEERARLDEWEQNASAARGDRDAAARAEQAWERLTERIGFVENDPALTVAVGSLFTDPSVRRLEIERAGTPALVDGEESGSGAVVLTSPDGSSSAQLEEVPVLVSFHASYPDVQHILTRLTRADAPVRLEAVDLKRDLPGVLVRLELVWFVRRALREEEPA